jgi:twitching motility protein PilU
MVSGAAQHFVVTQRHIVYPASNGHRPLSEIHGGEGASDLFFSVGTSVHAKIEGRMRALDRGVLTSEAVRLAAYSLLSPEQQREFEATFEMNLGLAREGLGRFRINVYRQRGEVAMVIRYIKRHIPSFASLRLPETVGALIQHKYGQIFIVGSTGSGKSTTQAAMINYRNETLAGHIVTIEDPIEFTHEHKRSVVDQREVGLDTHSYEDALRNALRQAPDVVVIGKYGTGPRWSTQTISPKRDTFAYRCCMPITLFKH